MMPATIRGMTVANEPLGVSDVELALIRKDVERSFAAVLRSLRIDVDSDHNTKGTAARFARMMVDEVLRGRFHAAPEVTSFPNTGNGDAMLTVGPIKCRSMCSHHFAPILGQVWIGVRPGKRVIGLSKYSRLTEWVMARPQIQEEATGQLADALAEKTEAKWIGLVVVASHLCMTWRGVREHATLMQTEAQRGEPQNGDMEALRLLASKGSGATL